MARKSTAGPSPSTKRVPWNSAKAEAAAVVVVAADIVVVAAEAAVIVAAAEAVVIVAAETVVIADAGTKPQPKFQKSGPGNRAAFFVPGSPF
jgi:hypothetical protein